MTAPEQRSAVDRLAPWGTLITLVIGMLTLVVTVVLTLSQLKISTAQFRDSSRETHYSQIIDGLGSPAAAVQTSSMRLLVEYVEDRSNYHSDAEQQTGALDAIQTLAAFIEDQSSVPGFVGLHDYNSPQPIVLSRAAVQLVHLESDPALGTHVADLSRANLHGIYLSGLVPTGNLLAVAADLRRSALPGLDLGHVLPGHVPDLDFADLTCASLVGTRWADASVTGADFSGADLRGADLSHVSGLTSAQLHGATVGPLTRLPSGVHVSEDQAWGAGSGTCHTLVDHMTGMQAGWGYLTTHPCPLSVRRARHLTFSPPFDGRLRDLVEVCRIRAGRS
jgi:hypothetical protein